MCMYIFYQTVSDWREHDSICVCSILFDVLCNCSVIMLPDY